MADPDLRQELGIGLPGAGFKVPAEGVWDHAGHSGYLFQVYLSGEVSESIFVDSIDPVVLRLGESGLEADGRQHLQMSGLCKGGQAFYQCDDAVYAVYRPDLFDHSGDVFFIPAIDKNTPAGLFQQVADRLRLRQIQEGVSPEILCKVDHGRMDGQAAFLEVSVVISPVMGEIGAHQDNIAGMKTLDMIAYELGTAALVEADQFHFGMIMPSIVDKRVPVLPDAKGMGGCFGDL